MKQNGMKKWLALSMISVVSLGMVACNEPTSNDSTTAFADGYAYMAIDINPTVEFVLKEGKVASVDAVNDDAEVLVSEEEFVGMTAEEASETVVELAEELGYLNEENASVKITVEADDETYADSLEEEARKGAKRGSGIAKVNSEPRTADSRKERKLKDENADLYEGLTPGKVRLIKAIMRYDETMTFELGTTMSVDELADILGSYVDEYKDIVGEKLHDEFKEALHEKKDEVSLEMVQQHGEEYKALFEKLLAVNGFYRDLERNAGNVIISAEDVEAIIAILELENAEVISVSGVVTLESVDRYLDRHCVKEFLQSKEDKEALEAKKDAVEDVLENYDEDEYVLSAEEILALQEILGADIELEEVVTLESLEEIVEEFEEELEALKETLVPDFKDKEEMPDMEKEMKEFREEAHREMKDRIEEMKEGFKNEKKERKERVEEGKRHPAFPDERPENPETSERPEPPEKPESSENVEDMESSEEVEISEETVA